MKVNVLITPDGEILLFRKASDAIIQHSALGGTLKELPFQDDYMRPVQLVEYGPSGVNYALRRADVKRA